MVARTVARKGTDTPNGEAAGRVLVIGCGALARELLELVQLSGFSGIDVTCLPASLHNRPSRIPAAVLRRIRERRDQYGRIFVAYGDCGTGGRLDAVLEAEGIERLPGPHCYSFFAGCDRFTALAAEEIGTFYLTDFLARHFDRLVFRALGLDQHPELLPLYFGNYRRVVYLSQHADSATLRAAREAAAALGLEFVHRPAGHGDLGTALNAFIRAGTPGRAAGREPGLGPAPAIDKADSTAPVPANAVASPG